MRFRESPAGLLTRKGSEDLEDDLNGDHELPAAAETSAAEKGRAQEQRAQELGDGTLVALEYPYRPRVLDWASLPCGSIFQNLLQRERNSYKALLEAFLPLAPQLAQIPVGAGPSECQPHWDNGWFPTFDGIALYGLLATRNPRTYIEVGSGNSTKFARKAIRDLNLRTKIISIDPHPRAVVDQLCDEVIRLPLEEVPLGRFASLGPEDVIFVDSSHRCAQGSDVTVFFTQVLPTLGAGCLYGLHDILLPDDYPAEWFRRYYNEQYLLMAYLLGGAGGDKIVLPMRYIVGHPVLREVLAPLVREPIQSGAPDMGSGFWMQRA